LDDTYSISGEKAGREQEGVRGEGGIGAKRPVRISRRRGGVKRHLVIRLTPETKKKAIQIPSVRNTGGTQIKTPTGVLRGFIVKKKAAGGPHDQRAGDCRYIEMACKTEEGGAPDDGLG